jgi:Fur family transcriptional regulator, ferric uptake regulator
MLIDRSFATKAFNMIRSTKQRRAIQDVFARANNPLSVEEVLAAAEREVDGIGIATVYRNIKALVDDGIIVAVDLPSEAPRYEQTGKGHHHHFRCNECGRVFDTKACADGLKKMTAPGFRVTSHEIILYGECAACRRA